MALAFDTPEVEKVKFNCNSKECNNYKTYDNCRQCSRNTELKGRRAYRDRFEN